MNLGFSEMLFIFVVALLIFGPKKLPEIGRQIGKAMAEFKRATNDFKFQLENEMRQIELQETLKRTGDSLQSVLEPPSGTIASGSTLAKLEAAVASSLAPKPIDPEPGEPHPGETEAPNTTGEVALPPAGNGESGTAASTSDAASHATMTAAAVEPEIKSDAAKGPHA
jgi:sec-independent protein translocase protein TatB